MSSEILVSEVFYSIQGEGVRVGVPSVFVRVFGCNLTCQGFGQARNDFIDSNSMPHNVFDATKVNTINDLPIFGVGCDSSASWSKKYKHLSKSYSVDTLVEAVAELIPQDSYPDIVITGGEPLLPKYQKFWPEFIKKLEHTVGISIVTFETNGTQKLQRDFKMFIETGYSPNIYFSVSPKLSLAGDPKEKRWHPEVVDEYMNSIFHRNWEEIQAVTKSKVYLKFVIRDDADMIEVGQFVDELENYIEDVYLMPEGATDKLLSVTTKDVVALALKNGYKYSPRLHVDIFGNKWGT